MEQTLPLDKQRIWNSLRRLPDRWKENSTGLEPQPALLDEMKLKKWVHTNSSGALGPEITHTLSEGVCRVSFAEFQRHMLETADLVAAKIAPEEPYVLVADEEGKSFWWVLQMCRDRLPPNFTLVSRDSIGKYAAENPTVGKYVYLDDAAYTGKQVSTGISTVIHELSDFVRDDSGMVKRVMKSDREVIIGVGYCTQYAHDSWVNAFQRDNVTLLESNRIDSVADTVGRQFGENSTQVLAQLAVIYQEYMRFGTDDLEQVTTTYFDHKMPDHWSFLTPIKEGHIIDKDGRTMKNILGKIVNCKFTPQIEPVYHHKKVTEICPWLQQDDLSYVTLHQAV